MKSLLIIVAGAAGACAIAIPAAVGLSGNPSFSQRIPVRVPTSAHVIKFDDHGKAIEKGTRRSSKSTTPKAAPSKTATSEPGDDNGTHSEPGDDRNHGSGGGSGHGGGHGSGGHGSDDGGA